MRSKSSSPCGGAGPMPSTPFSLCRKTSRSLGRWFATLVGSPMPKLTYSPSWMSSATRAAICSRVQRFMGLAPAWISRGIRGCRGGIAADRHHALDENARGHHAFRIERAELHDFAHFRDRAFRRGGHDRPEVARRLAIDEIAPPVALERLDQRVIGMDRVFEHVMPAVDEARLLALRERRAVGRRRVEGTDARARGANALGEGALRHELELDLARAVKRIEHPRIGLARKRADDLAHLPRLQQRGEPGVRIARIVVDDREVARAAADERVDEREGNA